MIEEEKKRNKQCEKRRQENKLSEFFETIIEKTENDEDNEDESEMIKIELKQRYNNDSLRKKKGGRRVNANKN